MTQTKAALAAELERARSSLDVHELYAHDMENGVEPDGVQKWADDEDRSTGVAGAWHEWRLYRAAGAAGGYLVMVSAYPTNTSKNVSVAYFDRVRVHKTHLRLGAAIAVERLEVARQKALDAKRVEVFR